MPPVQFNPGHKHVALGSPWLGEFSLLQNDDSIPDMSVDEMNPHRCPCRRPSWTPLDRSVPRFPGGQEGHPVGTWLPARGLGFPIAYPTRFLSMLRLQMERQKPERHLLPVLNALYPNPLPIQVGSPLSRHLSPICRLYLSSCRLSWVEDHFECLLDIDIQAHPVKQPYQGAECP